MVEVELSSNVKIYALIITKDLDNEPLRAMTNVKSEYIEEKNLLNINSIDILIILLKYLNFN